MTDPVYHEVWHDPVFHYRECEVCGELLRRAFNKLADTDLSTDEIDAVMQRILELAGKTRQR